MGRAARARVRPLARNWSASAARGLGQLRSNPKVASCPLRDGAHSALTGPRKLLD